MATAIQAGTASSPMAKMEVAKPAERHDTEPSTRLLLRIHLEWARSWRPSAIDLGWEDPRRITNNGKYRKIFFTNSVLYREHWRVADDVSAFLPWIQSMATENAEPNP